MNEQPENIMDNQTANGLQNPLERLVMLPMYDADGLKIFNCDFREIIFAMNFDLIITDPPYNVGYGYDEYKDRLSDNEYIEMLNLFERMPAVFIHYPEEMIKYVCYAMGSPEKVASWIYNANTPRQHRMIAWFGCKPDFSKVKQPYKNLNDKRIIELIKNGSNGTNLYDWWNVEQVKNVSEEKTEHPCQIPEEIYRRIILTTTSEGDTVLDPFMGSGTALRVARELNRKAIGIDISKNYCEIAIQRIEKYTTLFSAT